MHQIYEDRNELEFFVRLCQDVLLEILQFGSRVRITKLERLGRRLHRIIESFFKLMPFLRLRIEINQLYSLVNFLKYKYREKLSEKIYKFNFM